MVSEKIVRFQNKNKDLNQLAQQIVTMLQADGYKTQMTTNSPVGTIIQATKAGILRDIITADRAFTIMITGDPNNFVIHIGIGKFIQNIGGCGSGNIALVSSISGNRYSRDAMDKTRGK